jgi:hypothetical protein
VGAGVGVGDDEGVGDGDGVGVGDGAGAFTPIDTCEKFEYCPSLAVSFKTYVPAALKVAVVLATLGLPKVT